MKHEDFEKAKVLQEEIRRVKYRIDFWKEQECLLAVVPSSSPILYLPRMFSPADARIQRESLEKVLKQLEKEFEDL